MDANNENDAFGLDAETKTKFTENGSKPVVLLKLRRGIQVSLLFVLS